MTSHITTPCLPQSEIETTGQLFGNWFDPIEAGLRDRAREFLQAMLEAELDEVLAPLALRPGREAVERRFGGGCWCQRSPPRPPVALAAGNIREGGDRGAARPAEHSRRHDNRVEEPHAAGLSAPYARCRCADRQLLSRRHQHAPCAPRARCPVRRPTFCARQASVLSPPIALVRGRYGTRAALENKCSFTEARDVGTMKILLWIITLTLIGRSLPERPPLGMPRDWCKKVDKQC
jgi:hypothetical protein